MQAQITSLPISSDYYLQIKQGPSQTTTTISALYFVLLTVNFCSYFNYGYFITRSDNFTTANSAPFELPFIFALSFTCNIVFSFFPKRFLHKLFTKYFFIATLILHISARLPMLFFTHNALLLCLSQALIGVTQTVISVYSLQWCLYFGNERERLSLIHRICLTPITAVSASMLIELISPATLVSVSMCVECGVMLLCVVALLFIQSDYLENKTLNLTDEFLNKSLENGDAELSQRSEINDKFCLLSLAYCVIFIQMFVFGRTLFGYNGVYAQHGFQWALYKVVISFFLPLCGLLFSSFLTYWLPYKNNLVVNFMFNFIFFICGLAPTVLYEPIREAFKHNDTVMCYVVHGVLAFTNPMLLPLAYCFINSYIYSKEQNVTCMKSITSVVNTAIIAGVLSTAVGIGDERGIGIADVVMSIACVASFAVFVLFIAVASCNRTSEKLENKTKVYESYVYLMLASSFGKFVMFIWDECHSDDLFDDVNKYSGALMVSGDNNKVSETTVNVDDEEERNNENGIASDGIGDNKEVLAEEVNYDCSKTSGVTFNANFIESGNAAHSNEPHFPMQVNSKGSGKPPYQEGNTFGSTGFDIKQSLSSANNANTEFFSFNVNKNASAMQSSYDRIDDEFEAKIKGE